MKLRTVSLAVLALFAAVALAAPPTNAPVCPVMGKPSPESGPREQWGGLDVGFCCPGCQSRWSKATDAEKDAMLAKAK